MTPWQLKICLGVFAEKQKRDHDNAAWFMWHQAVLGRIEKMPPLNDFMSTKKAVKGINERDIINRLKNYQRKREKHGVSSS